MYHIYVYVFDTLADWELGYVTAFRALFQKGRAGCIAHNGWYHKRTGQNHGRSAGHPRLRC